VTAGSEPLNGVDDTRGFEDHPGDKERVQAEQRVRLGIREFEVGARDDDEHDSREGEKAHQRDRHEEVDGGRTREEDADGDSHQQIERVAPEDVGEAGHVLVVRGGADADERVRETRRGGDDRQPPQERWGPEGSAEVEGGRDDALDADGDDEQRDGESPPLLNQADIRWGTGDVVAGVLILEEDVDAVGDEREDGERRREDRRLVRPAGDVRRPEGEGEKQDEDADDVELGVLVDDVAGGFEFFADERRDGRDDQQVEDGAPDDGADAERELAVAQGADDDGAEFGKAGADGDDDGAVDGDGETVVAAESTGRAFELFAPGPDDRRRDEGESHRDAESLSDHGRDIDTRWQRAVRSARPVASYKYRGRDRSTVSDRWLYAWGLASVGLGGASLVVPLYVVSLGGGPVTLGVLAAAAAAGGAPGALVVGRLADRTGHRRGYVLGAIGVVAAGLGTVAAVDSIPVVIAANAAVWFAFAAATPVLTLLAVVGAPESEWSDRIARLNKWQGVGWALGLLVGFVVVVGGERLLGLDTITVQRTVCLVCAASAGVGGFVAARTLPAAPEREPAPRRLRRAIRGATRFGVRGASFPFTPVRMDPRGLHPRRFVRRFTPTLALYFAAVTLAFAGFGAFFAPLPAYLAGVGFGSDAVFGLYLALNVGTAVAFGAAATLVSRYEVALVHAGSLAVRGVALPVVVLSGGVLASTLPLFVLIGLTWAVIAVSAATLVARLAPPIVRGEALGVYGALSTVASGAGGVVGGGLAATGYGRAFGVASVLVFAGAGVVLVLRWRVADGSTATERAEVAADRSE